MATALHEEVYQNGVQCDIALADTGGDSLTKIKPGASIQVRSAYSITDTSDLEVEVKKLFSFSGDVLAKANIKLA